LLRRLLDTDQAVTVLVSRAPQLPSGVVASLAHDDEIVVAAVSRTASVRALGIDIEPVGAVDGEVADAVRRPEERDLDPTWVFVAKEAMYKAWSTQGGRFLRHEDVSITDTGGGSFVATVLDAGRSFTGSSTVVGGRVVALVVDIGHDEE
jgi:4'-phosphopantetheinyl transferase EntD